MKTKQLFGAAALALTAMMAHAADGEVLKVDMDKATVRLKHGEIKSLDMPPMTMNFRVRDASLLKGLAEGDQVTFEAAKDGGQYIVTAISKK